MHNIRFCALCFFLMLIMCGCGGGKTSPSSPAATGTVSGTITLPSNTNAKLFDIPFSVHAAIFSSFAHAETITDLTKLTVKSGSTTINPDAQGKYSLTINTGTNIDITVAAPSGNVVLIAVIPEIKNSIATTQDIDTKSTAVALIYKNHERWELSLPQIQAATSSLERVENEVKSALADGNIDSITNNSTVVSSASSEARKIYQNVTPSGVIVFSEYGKAAVTWNASYSYSNNLYMASQTDVTRNSYSNLPDGLKITDATSPYIIHGVSTEKTYYFVVTSVDYYGNESLESEKVSVTPQSGDAIVKTASKVTAGTSHTCAVFTDGTVKCWGSSTYGELGNGKNVSYNVPVAVKDILNAKEIAAGYGHTCAIINDGSVTCWGFNGTGQLGNGNETDSYTPVPVLNITNALSTDAGYYHTCAVLSDGKVMCWGWNSMGQLGNDEMTKSSTPVAVPGINNAVSVSAGAYHTCALISDGTVKCWGENLSGQLGNGTKTNSTAPVSVSGVSNAVQITAGAYRTCAVVSGKTVVCWGKDYFSDPTGTEISGTENAMQVATGYNQTCAILKDSSSVCWRGSETQKTLINYNTALLSLGDEHGCAISVNGELGCWGENDSGQIGGGTNIKSNYSISPFVNMQ